MNFYTTLLEQYALMEKLEDVIASNPSIERKTIEHYHSTALPDNNKSDTLLRHVLKMHNAGAITPETAHLLKPQLTALAATNQLNKLKNFNTLEDHQNATKDIMDKAVTKKQRVDKNTPVMLNTDDILVRQHLNHESAIKGARLHPENPVFKRTREHGKAQWCLSVDDKHGKTMFDRYTENGKNPVFTIFNKGTKRSTAMVPRPSDTYDSNEIRNETDNLVSPYRLLKDNPGIEHFKPIMDHINKYMPEVHDIINQVPFNANKKQLVDSILSPNKKYRDAASLHDLNPYMDDILPNKTAVLHLIKIKYPFESHHIDAMLKKNDPDELQGIAERGSLEPHHIDKLVDSKYPKVAEAMAWRKDLEPRHIDKLVDSTIPDVTGAVARQDDLEPRHVKKLLNTNDLYTLSVIAGHKGLAPHQIAKLLEHPNKSVQMGAAMNPSMTPMQIEEIFNRKNKNHLYGLTNNSALTDEHVVKLLRLGNSDIRENLTHSGKLYKSQLEHMSENDESEEVRDAADENIALGNYKKDN